VLRSIPYERKVLLVLQRNLLSQRAIALSKLPSRGGVVDFTPTPSTASGPPPSRREAKTGGLTPPL